MLSIKSFTFNAVRENTYLLYNSSGETVIIDPGCYSLEEQTELSNFISQQQLKPIELLNTHSHLDHVFGNKFIAEKYHLTLKMHINDQPVFDAAPHYAAAYGLPFKNYEGPIVYLNEGDSILLKADELKIIHTPGHSPGSICFYHAQQNFIVSGDVLFYETIGTTDLPMASQETLLHSIKTKLLTLPSQTTVYPGHGKATAIGWEKQHNPYLQ